MSFSSPPAQVHTIGRKHFVWGMEWRLLAPEESLSNTLKTIKKEGYAWYATSDIEDIIGISKDIPQSRLSMYSAALHLAERFSHGGLELFALALREDISAVIALNEHRPIPGYDYIGSRVKVQSLIEEFEAIQIGQKIRRIGNNGLLKDEQSISLLDIFDDPSTDSSLIRLYQNKHLKWMAAAGGLIATSLGAANYYVQQSHTQEMNANPVAIVNHNPAYIEKTSRKLKSLGPSADIKLQAWMQQLRHLPAQHQGWALTSVECIELQCTALWQRQYGSTDDFFKRLPSNAQSAQEIFKNNDRLNNTIETRHSAAFANASSSWSLDQLPHKDTGTREMSSWLQDMSLLGTNKVSLDAPQLWGAESDPAHLIKPLWAGTWTMTMDFYLSTVVQIPKFAQITKMKLDLPTHSFQIAGDYYVQADRP